MAESWVLSVLRRNNRTGHPSVPHHTVRRRSTTRLSKTRHSTGPSSQTPRMGLPVPIGVSRADAVAGPVPTGRTNDRPAGPSPRGLHDILLCFLHHRSSYFDYAGVSGAELHAAQRTDQRPRPGHFGFLGTGPHFWELVVFQFEKPLMVVEIKHVSVFYHEINISHCSKRNQKIHERKIQNLSNQSINQSSDQSINRAIKRPVNQSINRWSSHENPADVIAISTPCLMKPNKMALRFKSWIEVESRGTFSWKSDSGFFSGMMTK